MPRQVVIENPVINSPFSEPVRYFKFDDDGITDEIAEGRRQSGYFIPVPAPKGKRKGQVDMLAESWIAPRFQPSPLINKIRPRLSVWRSGGYHGVTRTTARLLEHWNNPERERKLFFCQIEALETAIYLAEVAKLHGRRGASLSQPAPDYLDGLPNCAIAISICRKVSGNTSMEGREDG